MPKAALKLAARHGLFLVPNASAKVTTLVSELNTIRTELAALNARKEEVAARLLKRVVAEGGEDPDGKIRLQTDDSNIVVVETANRHVDTKKLLALGVKATIIEKATKVTEYSYVSVTARKAEE